MSFCFTAQQWLDSLPHILCCCNSSRVANRFCDFVLCLHQWLLFASLLLLRAINTTLLIWANYCLSRTLIRHPGELSACFISHHTPGLCPPGSLLITSWCSVVSGGWQQVKWWDSQRDCCSARLCSSPATTLRTQRETELSAGLGRQYPLKQISQLSPCDN